MQPAEFIENLGRHYSKRHETEAKQIAWTREMIEMFKGTDPIVLAKAYQLIRDEHEERAFPLPATLKRFIARAADLAYPEHMTWKPFIPEPTKAPDQSSVARVRALVEKARANISVVKSPESKAEWRDVSRPAFEEMQRNSPNQGLHVDHSALTRRMTGERDD